jgi:hypothetical protein
MICSRVDLGDFATLAAMRRAGIVLLLSSGCATIHPDAVVQSFGESNPAHNKQIAEQAMDRGANDEGVKVISGKLPDGLDIQERGTKIVVQPGFESKYTVLGTIEADYNRATASGTVKNVYWAWNYDEGWRKGLCYPQVPLKILTLGIWSFFVPLHYPCFASIPGDESDRQTDLQAVIARGAKVMGGNLAILTASVDTTIITASRYGVSSEVVPSTALRGFVLNDAGGAPQKKSQPTPVDQQQVYCAGNACVKVHVY